MAQALDSGDLTPLGLHRQGETRKNRLAFEQDRASPTGAQIAAPLRAGEQGFLPQCFEQRRVGFAGDLAAIAVERELQNRLWCHRRPFSAPGIRPPTLV